MDFEDISKLGWTHDVNDDGEETPSLFNEHGYSKGFSIDNQRTDSKTAFLLYYFPDVYAVIDRIVDCGHGDEDKLFRGYLKNIKELESLMDKHNIICA